MPRRSARPARPSVLVAATCAVATAAAVAPAGALALGPAQQRGGQGTYDVRSVAQAPAAQGAAARSLADRLGPQARVEIDAISGTPRQLLRTDGALTGPSSAAPATIVLDYVRAHQPLFKLTAADLAALGAPADVVSPAGIHHLRWTQREGGLPVLGGELRAFVASDGRLLGVQGSPLPDTAVATTTPKLSAPAALARVRHDAGASGSAPSVSRSGGGVRRVTTFSDDARAQLVVFPDRDRNRLAWNVRSAVDADHYYGYVIDAASGAVLKRANYVRSVSGHGAAWASTPLDPLAPVAFPDGWVTSGGSALRGDFAHAYPDVLDLDRPNDTPLPDASTLPDGGEVAATSPDAGDGTPEWNYSFRPVTTNYDPQDPDAFPDGGYHCSVAFPCSWSSWFRYSWRDNLAQNAVQVFSFVNTFHDHLAAPPIGFDAGSDNFETATPGGADGDPVVAEASDGASIDDGTVDAAHFNNANMLTLPEGESPRMQMYLFSAPSDGSNPTIDGNGGDDASVVFHEYTHGLSSRLVTDILGQQALNSPQSGAMGEAWSDWYALDYLAQRGLVTDDPARAGELVLAGYLTQGQNWLRSAALDCPVGVDADGCPPGGGYTFGDYGHVWDGPEVHADGEIFAQTLWDLRTALVSQLGEIPGIMTARSLVTEALRMAPEEPSFLDFRDKLLLADEATGGTDHDLIWSVFAARGMGYFASTQTASDPAPYESFALPPAGGTPSATLRGTVTDAATGTGLAGATVSLPGSDAVAQTDANGDYVLGPVPAIGYPRVLVTANGYADPDPTTVDVAADGSSQLPVRLRRDWAQWWGGAQLDSFTAPDLTAYGCGPVDAIDGTKLYGWSSYQPDYDGAEHAQYGMPPAPRSARSFVVRLPQAIDVTSFEVDPGAVCGDDDSASLGQYKLETSSDGVSWTTSSTGTFARAHNHRLNVLPPNPGTTAGIRWVRMTMLSPQGGAGSSEEYFMDLAELGVYGTAVRAVQPPDDPDPVDPGPPAEPQPRDPTPPGPGPRDPDPAPQPQPRVVPSDPAADTKRPLLSRVAVVLPKRHSLATLLGKAGLPLRLRSDERVTTTVTITLPAATARRLGLSRQRRGTVAIARLSNAKVVAGRTTTLRIRLPRNTRIWLQRRAPARLTFGVAILATDAARNVATKLVSATARR